MVQPFDWQRIFLGDFSWFYLLEIVFRTVILYLYAIGMIRLTGSRGIGQLSAFDIVIIIALGSAVGDPMFYPEVPLLHGIVVITVIVLLQRFISVMVMRSDKVEEFFEGTPLALVEDGRLVLKSLQEATLSQEDVFMRLRRESVEQLGQVKHVYLEHDGSFSIFKYPRESSHHGLPILPPRDLKPLLKLNAGSLVSRGGYYACHRCGEPIKLSVEEVLPVCPNCGNETWVKAAV